MIFHLFVSRSELFPFLEILLWILDIKYATCLGTHTAVYTFLLKLSLLVIFLPGKNITKWLSFMKYVYSPGA